MRTSLAWHNLLHHKARTAVGVAGVTFAAVLVFMQLGFLGAVETTATRVYEALDFDLLLRSPRYRRFNDPQTFPRHRLGLAEAMPEVQSAAPLYLGLNNWRIPATGHRRGLLIFGVRPEDAVFLDPETEAASARLIQSGFVLVDRRSRREFGPKNGREFSDADVGVRTEVGGRAVEVVGHFALGTGFSADGALLVSVDGFARLLPNRSADQVSLGLVKLRPGENAEAVRVRLAARLPADVEVATRAEAIDRELRWWTKESSMGLIFQLGVVMAVVVGTAIVYQVLQAEVAGQFRQYATLKAMGYGGWFLVTVLVRQALGLALAGFLAGVAVAQGLYWITGYYAQMPMAMKAANVVWVLVLTVLMCGLSALGAARKLVTADPAELF